jgi:5-methyltetrahydropteroyltriglutamate--homocysteine methyltransferase
MAALLPVVIAARPQALLFEAANPRHAHEWTVFRDARIPEDKILVPGVLGTTTNYVEHPALVAERIERFAGIVGRERVIAGTDCGFGTFAGFGPVDPDIAWLKLRSLVEGAEIASRRLWPGR